MRLVLRGVSALAYWLSAYDIDEQRKGDRKVLYDCIPTKQSLDYLGKQLPQLKEPYHLLVPSWIREKERCALATSRYRYAAGSFYQAENGLYAASPQATRDATKRLALEADGITVITVTTAQLRSPLAMEAVAHEVAQRCGVRLRQRDRRFPARHRDLYRRGWSLDELFAENWLAESSDAGAIPS